MSKLVRAMIERGGHPTRHAPGLLVLALALGLAAPGSVSAKDAPPEPVHGDLTVDQAVKLALERNQDLLTSGQNVDAASGQQKQALQRYLPSLSASGSFSHNLNQTGFFDPTTGLIVTGNQDNYGVRYVLNQNLIDIAAIRSISAAGKSVDASKLNYAFSRSDLVLGAKQQYYVLLAAQYLATVNDSALVLSERELKRTESLFELGMVAKSDVLKAQVRVSNSKLDVIKANGAVVDERARLARVLGQPPTDDLRASDPLTETPVTIDSSAIYQEAVANRPDLQAALKTWEAAKAQAGATRAGFLPTVFGQVGYSNQNASGFQPFAAFNLPIDDPRRPSRTAGVGINFPLFEGMWGRHGAVQTAQARAEQERYAYDKKRLDVEVEVRGAINSAQQANEGLIVAKDGLTSADEDLKLSQEKYNVGSGTILDLLDPQVNLQKARQQYVVALTAARIAEAQIERARGVQP
jgi:outer membrane protein TolC